MHEPTDSLADTLSNLVDFKLNNVFTGIPARVIDVDLDRNCCDVQPLIRRKDSDNTQNTLPPYYDVPFQILSADTGKFKITMPIRIGDTVQLIYSQRDLFEFYGSDGKTVVDSLSVLAHQSNPILAIPCLFTQTNPTEVRSDAVVIQSGSSNIIMLEDGQIFMNPSNRLVVNGDVQINGSLSIDGASVQHNGTSIDESHRHSGVMSGGSNTGTPV